MLCEYENKGKLGVIKIVGRIDVKTVVDFRKYFNECVLETEYVVLNCSELEFIDSTGLGAMVACLKKVTELQGDIYIAELQSRPMMLFEMTRSNKIFKIYDDVEVAVKDLSAQI